VRIERAIFVATACVIAACSAPATFVEVVIDTDAPADRGFSVSATVMRASAASAARTPLQIERGTGVGQAGFPASFSVVPRAGGGRDDGVTLQLEATMRARTAGEPDIRFRRTARWQFTPGTQGRVRVFLPVRCGTITEGCASASPCTIAALCEERGLTCGDDGTCVTPDVRPEPRSDAGNITRDASVPFDSAIDASTDVAMDAAADVPMDARADAAMDARVDAARDTGVADGGAGLAAGRACTSGGPCAGGVCVSDMAMRQVCSNACTTTAQCPPGWSCTTRSQCEPPRTCTGNFAWTNWFGDGSLRLAGTESVGLNGPTSYTYGCADSTSRITVCGSALDLSFTGPQTSVLRGPITSIAIPGARVAANIRAAGPQLFLTLENAQHLYDINVDAPATEVIIRATSNLRELSLVGTIRARELYLDVPAGSRIVVAAMLQCRLTITTNVMLSLSGTIMGLRSNVPAPPTPMVCP
jgi:hypothetical protein